MINTHILLQFIEFGIYANFIAMLIVFIFTIIKFSKLAQEEKDELIFFLKNRSFHIKKNHSVVRIVHFLLIFLPTYKVWTSAIILYNYLLIPGAIGIYKAVRKADEFSIVTVIVYK